jgi:hypothetical protein
MKTKPANKIDQTVRFSTGDAKRIANTVRAYESGRRPRNPSTLPRAAGGGGGVASTIRLGQFTGFWPNEPGESGADNVKRVKLYVQEQNATGANDWIPETDGNGNEVIAVTINLFSYIPTRSGNDSYMWCAVTPISSVPGDYPAGGYSGNTPIMTEYEQLWLLISAEC